MQSITPTSLDVFEDFGALKELYIPLLVHEGDEYTAQEALPVEDTYYGLSRRAKHKMKLPPDGGIFFEDLPLHHRADHNIQDHELRRLNMCGLRLKYGEFSREEDEQLEGANTFYTGAAKWCRELFHPRNRMGSDKEPWMDEEIESLVKFVKELGPNYKEIGLRLNRSYRACLNRYRFICKNDDHLKEETSQSSKRYGPGLAWPEEDLKRLQQLVDRFGPRWKVISLWIDRSLYAVRSFAFKFIQWEKRKYREVYHVTPWRERQLRQLYNFIRDSTGCDAQRLVSAGNLVEQERRMCWYDASQRTGKSATECRVKWDDFKELIRSGIEEELDKEEVLARLMEATAPLPQPEPQERRLFTVGESLELLRLMQEKGPQWVEIGRELFTAKVHFTTMDDPDILDDDWSDEEEDGQQPHFEELYSDEAVQDELSRIREEDPELAQRLSYFNDCGVFGRDSTALEDETAAAGEELAEPREVLNPVADTVRVRTFFLEAASKVFQSSKDALINRKRASTAPEEAEDRLRETNRANVHFKAALTWAQSRFERMEGGRYPAKVFWPYNLKPRTLEYCAQSFSDFVAFLFVKRVLVSGESFSFESLDDFASTKTLLYDFIEYYIGDRPMERAAGVKKSSALQRQKKMTAAERLQAAGKPLPGTLTSKMLGLTRAFRLLCLSNPAHSSTVWIGDRTRKQMEDYVTKNFGAVAALTSWPLLFEDVLYAIEEQPPEDMNEWSRYILLLIMTKFGFRPSSLLQLRPSASSVQLGGTKSTGVLFEDIVSIAYDKDNDKWKIIFNVTYSKTDNSPAYSKPYTITSENYKGDLARILVAFFAVRGAFERPLHEAMASGTQESFKIREDFMKLSIFGGPEVGQFVSKQYSNERVPRVDAARRTFNWFCARLGLPESFLTPRSARQGYSFSKCFAYITDETSPTYEECIKKARGLREWTTKAAEAYLRPSELPIEELLTTVMDKRRRYPNRVVNAYDEYMTVSKIVRLPDVQGPGDVDRRAIEALGKLAEESHFKRLKSVSAGLAADYELLKQSGRPADDPDIQKLLNQLGGEALTEDQRDAKLRRSAAKFAVEAKRKALNLIKTDYIRRAMHGSISLPSLPPLSPKVLDLVATSQLLASRTHCRWSMTQFAVTYPLNFNQPCLCPFYMCGFRFRQADGPRGIVAHMNDAHFQPEQDFPTCRKHPGTVITSVDDWLSHWSDNHRYFLCFECAEGDDFEVLGTFSRGHVMGTLCFSQAQPVHARSRPYALHLQETEDKHTKTKAMDGVKWIYADPAPYDCNCHQSRCPYNDNPLIHPLLQHDEYLTAGALTVSAAGQGASRWMKRKWFLTMAKAMLIGKPYTEDEIEQCMDYYFNAQYPPGRETFVVQPQPASGHLRDVRDEQDQQHPSTSTATLAYRTPEPPTVLLQESPQSAHTESESIGGFMRKFIHFWK